MRLLNYMSRLLLLVFFLAFAPFVQAEKVCQPFTGGKVDSGLVETMLAAAERGRLYRIERDSSEVGFCITSFSSMDVRGRFSEFVGGLALNGDADSVSQVLFSINTDSVDTGNRLINNMVKADGFLDTLRHTEIMFVSKAFVSTGARTGRLYGDLTLRGITRPVMFRMEFIAEPGDPAAGHAHEHVHVDATAELNRHEFGMDGLGGIVPDTIRICLKATGIVTSQTAEVPRIGPPLADSDTGQL